MSNMLSKFANTVAKGVTSAFDNMESSMFGGQLSKAELVVYKDVGLTQEIKKIPFFINPHTIQVSKEAKLESEEVPGGTESKKFNLTYPLCLKLGEMWFDTYDDKPKVSVREKYINDLESLLDYIPETHYLPIVVFNWGKFSSTARNPQYYKFFCNKVTVDYTLFLPDATPVRAKVDLTLEQVFPQKDENAVRPKESPDHAKLYTVKKGDTLQGIAMKEYDDAREWRRIAKTNNLNDPMELRPGMKLLVPPILK